MNKDESMRVCERRFEELGDVTFERIEVAPFAVERFGTIFGLVVRERENDDDVWAVEAQPGNYMAFFETVGQRRI